MSNYTQITDFSVKDGLTQGDPEKLILGSDIDAELAALDTAITSKYDTDNIASQVEAEAGALNTVLMTPLRVVQAIAAGVTVEDGNILQVYNSGDTSFLQLDSEVTVAGNSGLWLNQATPSTLNYSILGNGTNTFVNARTGGAISLRNNNSTLMSLDASVIATTLSGGTVNFTANQIDLLSGTNLRVRDGGSLFVQDATDADSLEISHNGTDGTFAYTGTNIVASTGASAYTFDDDVRVLSGGLFRVYDATSNDYMQHNHDGTDFNSAGTNTTDWNVSGITSFNVAGDIAITGGNDLVIEDLSATRSATFFLAESTFSTLLSNVTTWAISGITTLSCPTVDADFDAITATSYGGIAEADLVDASVAFDNGTFSADWSGFTTSVNNSVIYARAENVVTLVVPAFSGTSNNAFLNSGSTDVPAALRPNNSFTAVAIVTNNGTNAFGKITVTAAGQITFGNGTGGGGTFTSSGVKGIPNNFTITYPINSG